MPYRTVTFDSTRCTPSWRWARLVAMEIWSCDLTVPASVTTPLFVVTEMSVSFIAESAAMAALILPVVTVSLTAPVALPLLLVSEGVAVLATDGDAVSGVVVEDVVAGVALSVLVVVTVVETVGLPFAAAGCAAVASVPELLYAVEVRGLSQPAAARAAAAI